MNIRVFNLVSRACALALVASMAVASMAQSVPASKQVPVPFTRYKWDFMVGYSFLAPHDTVYPKQPNGTVIPLDYHLEKRGLNESLTYFLNDHVGLQFEAGEHDLFTDTGPSLYSDSNSTMLTLEIGAVYRWPHKTWTPFVHGLAGSTYVDGPSHEPFVWGPGITVGGGIDYQVKGLSDHLAIRLFQTDYEFIHNNSNLSGVPLPQVWRDEENVNAFKLSAGAVWHFHNPAPPPAITLSCSVSPASVFPGDPVSITATPDGLNPKYNVIYGWSGSGVTGSGASASVATASLAPGTYTVESTVKEGKSGKEGLQPWEAATCQAKFTVKDFEPPTISCSASPSTILPGGTSTITSVGLSPQNRPLTYTYSASGGSVAGSGTTAQFSSTGAAVGAVGITCGVSDDKGHSATASTTVTIQAPPVPPQPHVQAQCSIGFSNDPKRPTRVDNEAKACLDQVALGLKQQADAKLVVVGSSNAAEKADTAKKLKLAAKNKHTVVEQYADQRAVNAKDYLVTDQGIDASRISAATSAADGQSVANYLVPSGANFSNDVSGTTPVDETAVKVEKRVPLPLRHPAAKKK